MKQAGVAKQNLVIALILGLAVLLMGVQGISSIGFYGLQANSDLKPISITYSPLGPQTGDYVTFTATVENAGSGSTDSSFVVSLFIDGVNIANDTVPTLGAGLRANASFGWTAESELHDVYVKIDPDNTIAELDETNNRLNASIGVDWPTQQQGPERWGCANTAGPSTNYTVWTTELDVAIKDRALAIADDKVFTGTTDEVVALNAQTGALVWSYTVANGFQYPDAHMTVADGKLFTGSDNTNNSIFAFNASTGDVLWVVAHGGSDAGFTSHYQGMMHYSMDDKIFAREPDTGNYLWNFSTGGIAWNSPGIFNDTLYFGTYNARLHAIDAFTGLELWQNNTGKWILGPPAVAYGNVYFGTSDGLGSDVFYSLNALDGSENWTFSVGDYMQAPVAVYNYTVYFGAGKTLYARDALNGAAIWSANLGNQIVAGPVISNNGIIFAGVSTSNTVYARNLTDGSAIWQYSTNGQPLAMALYDNKLYVTTDTGRIYAFGPQPSLYPISPANGTIVDRSGVSDTYDDFIVLKANLSDGSSGTSITFYANRTGPAYASNMINLGSNNTVNGIATLKYTPSSSDYAGRYVWWASGGNAKSEGARYFDVYGGLNVSFRYNDTFPNSSYESGDNVTVEVLLSALSPENETDLLNYYNAKINVTLSPPTESPVTFSLSNQSHTSIVTNYLANGTVNSCRDKSPDDYIDFKDDLVPDPLPVGIGPSSGYYLKWICNSTVCPGYENKEYLIIHSDDSDSWNGLDFLQIKNWDVCASGGEANGWMFSVFNNTSSTTFFWNGSYALQTEGGTWTASANASADYFFSGSASREFNVSVPVTEEAEAAPSAAGAVRPKKNISIEAVDNIIRVDGVNQISLDRGTSLPITIKIKNVGDFVVTDIFIEVQGLPPGWAVVSPSKIDSLGQNEIVDVNLYLFIPESAGLGKYELTVLAKSYYTKATFAAEIIVGDECEPCPQPSAWSECVEGKQTRTNYKCGPETDYKCVEWIEERECLPAPIQPVVDNTPVLLLAMALGAVVIWHFYWKK